MTTARTITIAGTEVRCPICSHTEFERQEVLVSAGVEADVVVSPSGDRAWTHRVKDGTEPVAEVCVRCGYVLLFVTPE